MNVPSLISIGVRLECVGINHSLVVDQLIELAARFSVQLIGLRIPDNLVCVDDLCLSWVEEWLLDSYSIECGLRSGFCLLPRSFDGSRGRTHN